MALTPGLHTVRDLFAKLERDAALLNEAVTADRFFNFVVTGYSLIDWVQNDPDVPESAKAKAVVDGLYKDTWLKVCGDLATASKHFVLTKRKDPITESATTRGVPLMGGGVPLMGGGVPLMAGVANIDIRLKDGTQIHGLELVENTLATWTAFFAHHGI
jgi:hypothetical protein